MHTSATAVQDRTELRRRPINSLFQAAIRRRVFGLARVYVRWAMIHQFKNMDSDQFSLRGVSGAPRLARPRQRIKLGVPHAVDLARKCEQLAMWRVIRSAPMLSIATLGLRCLSHRQPLQIGVH